MAGKCPPEPDAEIPARLCLTRNRGQASVWKDESVIPWIPRAGA